MRNYASVYLVVPAGGTFRETRRVELGPRALIIGRAASCDVRVDVPGVDEEHAKISEVALIAIGPDCAVGDVPLDPGCRRLVTSGDEIQIGSVVVALEGEDTTAPRSGDTVEVAAVGRRRPEGPAVRVVEGHNFGEELLLKEEGRDYVIGRGPHCDLVLEDREVSREHVKLSRRGYTVLVQDLTSTRGSWLGRSAVYTGSACEWTRPRMLRVGATVLSLELPEEVRKTAPPPVASAPMTPEPRPRSTPPSKPPPGPGVLASPPVPPVSAGAGGGAAGPGAPVASAGTAASRVQVFTYDAAPALAPTPLPPAPSSPAPGAVSLAPGSQPPPPPSSASFPGLVVTPPPSVPNRKAWKRSGTTIGKASGILLLTLAALAILGGLFVVFSLLE